MDIKKKKGNILKALLYVGSILLVIVAMGAVSGIAYGIYCEIVGIETVSGSDEMEMILSILFIVIGILFTIIFPYRTKYRQEMKIVLHTEAKSWLLWGFLFGMLLSMVEYAAFCTVSARYYNVTLNDDAYEVLQDFLQLENFLLFVCICIVGPIVEEFLCRFFFTRHFNEAYSPIVSVLFSSIIFSLLHLSNLPVMIILYIVDGFLLYLVYSRTASIWCTVFMHSGMNFYTTIVTYIEFNYVNVSVPFLVITACLLLMSIVWIVNKKNRLAGMLNIEQQEEVPMGG